MASGRGISARPRTGGRDAGRTFHVKRAHGSGRAAGAGRTFHVKRRRWPAPLAVCHAGRRTSTVRKRLATKAPSHRAALADGLPPEPWKSENAAVWFT